MGSRCSRRARAASSTRPATSARTSPIRSSCSTTSSKSRCPTPTADLFAEKCPLWGQFRNKQRDYRPRESGLARRGCTGAMPDTNTQLLPLLPLTQGVIFPQMVVTIALESEEARQAVGAAEEAGDRLVLVPRIDARYAGVGTVAA